jgi:membrane protease YdiL (CAAX protease family)
VLVAGLGALYMLAQGLLLNGFILADMARRGQLMEERRGLEAFAELYRRYRPVILAVLTATQFLIFLLLPLRAIRRWHTPELSAYLGLRRFAPAGLLSVAGTLFLLPVSSGIASWLLSYFPALQRWSQVGSALIVDPRPWPLAATLLAIAVTPGICEEVLFRGYLQRTLQRRLSFPWHFLVSGGLFALFHQQVLSLPSLLIVGFYLGFVYHRFGSLYLTMLCHFLYNGVLILLANFPPPWPALFTPEGDFRGSVVAGGAALLAATVTVMTLLRPPEQSAASPRDGRRKPAFP